MPSAEDVPAKRVRYRHAALRALLWAGLALACLVHLDTNPPLWWDEGWTMSAARNWVERGHYGQLLAGEFAPPGLAGSPIVVAPIALSFRAFGVGTWQGRLPSVVFTIGALYGLFALAKRLWGESVALASVVAALIAPFPVVHPIFVGRQALAELPMLFFLVGGYAIFFGGSRRRTWRMGTAIVMWGVALATKQQPAPFLSASLLIAALYALTHGRRKLAGMLVGALIGSIAVSQLLLFTFSRLVSSSAPIPGLYGVTAFLPFAAAPRSQALAVVVAAGLPVLAGLAHLWLSWSRQRRNHVRPVEDLTAAVALAALVLAWIMWYVALSLGSPRYLFPALLVGSMFVGLIISDLTALVRDVVRRSRGLSSTGRQESPRQIVQLLIAGALIAGTLQFSVSTVANLFKRDAAGSAAIRVARYLNTHALPDALVETYESELFVFLDRRYHYPPNELHVDLMRRTSLGEHIPINYDPLRTDPDYLVLGPQNHEWALYDSVVKTGNFKVIFEDGPYSVYERIRGQ